MQQKSDYAVLALIVANSMVITALGVGARISGFELPPAAIFGLLVFGAPIPVVLAVLPQMGIRVPTLSAPQPAPTERETPLHPAP